VVKPIVKLLRSTDTGVFIDRDEIQLGKRWRDQILQAIGECKAFWLFWCRHAADSREIRLEYQQGLSREKDILPILLDATPLPKPLDEFQWLDMSQSLGTHTGQAQGEVRYRGGTGKHAGSLLPGELENAAEKLRSWIIRYSADF